MIGAYDFGSSLRQGRPGVDFFEGRNLATPFAVLRLVAIAWVLVFAGGRGEAQVPELSGLGDEEITVDADSLGYDRRSDVINASGNVAIQRGEVILRADEVKLDRRTNEAEATGNTSLTDPESEIRAEAMRMNLDEETGSLEGAQIESRRFAFSLSGDRIEKGRGQSYHIENGRFTTCRCTDGPPSWSITGDQLDVRLDGYGDLRGGRFEILDVPVLYLPRAFFPVHRERQSGLLFPRLGFSNRRGVQLIQPLYWPISKSQDATVGIDIETSARIGVLAEYRYARSMDFHGQITASYFNEAIRGAATGSQTGRRSNPDIPENRWGVVSQHSQKIGSAQAYADLQLVGDDLFFREINAFVFDHSKDVAQRTLPFTTSRAGFVQAWERVTLQGESIFYQDLIGLDALTLQRVPEVNATGQKFLGSFLTGQMNASLTNFQRERGITGLRADLKPGASLRLPLGRSVLGSVRAALRETAYQLTESSMTGGFRGDEEVPDLHGCVAPRTRKNRAGDVATTCFDEIDLPGTSSRETFELGADVGTSLDRVFEFHHFGIDKLKHTIEPKLEYLFVPAVSQEELPVFDGIDRVNERSLVTLGVISRLLGRNGAGKGAEAGRVHELTRLSISQSYDFERRIPNETDPADDHFSNVDMALRVRPSRAVDLRFVSTYDGDDNDLSSATVSLRLRKPEMSADDEEQPRLRTRPSVRIAYRFITDNRRDLVGVTPTDPKDVDQLEASLLLPVTDRIAGIYATRYDIRGAAFFENHFGLRLLSACDCWSVDAGVTDKSNPNEIEFRFQVTLVGLGSAGSGGGGFGSN